jgi:hypothetical protein
MTLPRIFCSTVFAVIFAVVPTYVFYTYYFGDRNVYVGNRPKFQVGVAWLTVEGAILGLIAGIFVGMVAVLVTSAVRRKRKER